jgi:hypothetical protein
LRLSIGSVQAIKITTLSFLSITFQVSNASSVKETRSYETISSIQKIVKGKVTDEKGIPIPGVNVIIKCTTIGVQTDVDGSFAIEVPNASSILIFSFLGMQEQEFTAGNSSLLIVMKEEGKLMDEVIVVGSAK